MSLDYLDKLFQKHPEITDSTKKMYRYNLSVLNDKKPITSIRFLEDYENIMKKIEHLQPVNQKNYLASASSIISKSNSKNKRLIEAHKQYKQRMYDISKEINSNNVSHHIKENWVTLSHVRKEYRKYSRYINSLNMDEPLNDIQYNNLLRFLVLSLYTLIQPRREMDYTDMVVVDNDGDNIGSNILNINSKQFIFKNYKTVKNSGIQTIDIPKKLYNIILIYLKGYKMKFNIDSYPFPFLVWESGKPFKRLDIYKVLSSVFGKKTGSTNMRRLFITSKYGNLKKQMAEDAESMGTSIDVLNKHYVKNNLE